jgi:hypothetical protein
MQPLLLQVAASVQVAHPVIQAWQMFMLLRK